MRLFMMTLLVTGLSAPVVTYASGGDPITQIIDLLETMERDENLMSQYTKFDPDIASYTKGQLDQLQNQWKALTQSYGMSDTTSEQNARLWSANDWNQVLGQASGGNNTRFQELLTSYSKLYPNLQTQQTINDTTLTNTTYQQRGETDNAALAASAYVYDEINTHINNLETILHMVDNANKNQNEKAAIDLNSRLVAELGFINLEMLKLQSIHTQMTATHDQADYNGETLDKQFTDYKPS